jgi:hypothetical protein
MNGLEIAQAAAQIIGTLAPYIVRGLDLGTSIDPTLERQLRGAIEVANAIMLDSDKRFVEQDKVTDARLPPKP